MFTLQFLLLGSILFAVGIVAGVFFSKIYGINDKKNKELVEKLEQVELQHQLYRQEVEHHFSRTAELVNAMTGSYQAVFEHLRTGASQLCLSSAQSEDPSWHLLQSPKKNNIDNYDLDDEDTDLEMHA